MTTTDTAASRELDASTTGAGSTEGHTMPRAASREGGGTGVAPLRGNSAELLQKVLFFAGAILLPSGLVLIGLGWYGAANTPYEYDQMPYLISGGILGLGVTFVGGFLYFGSWMARIAVDQREAQQQLTDALRALTLAQSSSGVETLYAPAPGVPTEAATGDTEAAPVRVVAGRGKTVHRPDCDLIAGREDVTAVLDTTGLAPCRLCLS